MRAQILLFSCLCASALALKPRQSKPLLAQVDRSGVVGPVVSATKDPECCVYDNVNYSGQTFCSNTQQSRLGSMADRASSVDVSNACTMTLFEHNDYKGTALDIGPGGKISNLDGHTMWPVTWYWWIRISWQDQANSFRCGCNGCTWPCQDCDRNNGATCRACPPGYRLQGGTCVEDPVNSPWACTFTGNSTNNQRMRLTTRDDWSFLGNQMSGRFTSAAFPDACNATVFANRDFGGTSASVRSGFNGTLSSVFSSSINSFRCNCMTCDAKCADCLGNPTYCTKCVPTQFPTEGICWPDNGPEVCFFDGDTELGWRFCTRKHDVPVVAADFFDKAKFVRVPRNCSLRITQFWEYTGAKVDIIGASDVTHLGGRRAPMPTGKDAWTYRSLQVVCNADLPGEATTTTPAPRLPVGSSSYPSYVYHGCFKTNANGQSDMDMPTVYTRNMGAPKNPQDLCAEFCYVSGGDFFALQNGDECHCGSAKWVTKQGKAEDEAQCNRLCDGARGVVCGGQDRNSVYRITNAADPAAAKARKDEEQEQASDYESEGAPQEASNLSPEQGNSKGLFAYIGCFEEQVEGMPQLRANAMEIEGMTPAICAKNCQESGLFAIRENLCVCGSRDWEPERGRALETFCGVCPGDNRFKCGSKRQNSVYKMFV